MSQPITLRTGYCSSEGRAGDASLDLGSTTLELGKLLGRISACPQDFQLTLLKKVAGYSLLDAIGLASDLGISADGLTEVLTASQVLAKNRQFFRGIQSSAHPVLAHATDPQEAARLKTLVEGLNILGGSAPSKLSDTGVPPSAHERRNPLLRDIDTIYRGYIAEKRFEAVKLPHFSKQQQWEDLFQEYLKCIDKHVYTGKWKEILTQVCGGEKDINKKLSPQQIDDLFLRSTISQEMLFQIADRCGLNLYTQEMQGLLSKTRYRLSAEVLSVQKESAVEGLREILLGSLMVRGYRNCDLCLEDGSYVVRQIGQDKEKRQPEARGIEEITLAEDVVGIFNYSIIADRPCYKAKLLNGNWVVVHGNERSEEFECILDFQEIAGKPCYTAKLSNGKWVVVHGEERSEEFSDIEDLQEIAGKPCNKARLPNGNWVVVHGNERSEDFECILDFQEIAGKPCNKARLPNGRWVVVHGEERSEEFMLTIRRIQEIAGKPCYIAQGPPNANWVVVHGEEKSEKLKFNDIGGLQEIAGKPCYKARLPNGKYVVVHGEERSEEFSETKNRQEIAGKPCYAAKLPNGNWVVVHGNERSEEFTDIDILEEAAGKLYYKAKLPNSNRKITRHGNKDITDSLYFLEYNESHAFYRMHGKQELSLLHADGRQQTFQIDPASIASINFGKNHAVIGVNQGDSKKRIIINLDPHEVTEETPAHALSLNKEEQQYLKLINLVYSPDKKEIEQYLSTQAKQATKAGHPSPAAGARIIPGTKAVAHIFNQLIAKMPDEFKDYFAAKTTRALSPYFDLVLQQIAPQAFWASKRPKQSLADISSPFSLRSRAQDLTTSLNSGDPRDTSDKTVLLSELGSAFVATGLVAVYDAQGKGWLKFPAAPQKHVAGSKQIQFRIPVDQPGSRAEIALPLLCNSAYVETSIHALDQYGNETPMTPTYSIDGIAHVKPQQDTREITYSLSIKNAQGAVQDKTSADYQKFLDSHSQEFSLLSTGIGSLNDNCRKYLKGIAHLSPLERIKAIKEFISYHGYYDVDAGDLMSDKTDRKPEETFAIMEARATMLKMQGKITANKELAGVCADFSVLYASMLRASGIAAGIAQGVYIESDGRAKERNAHATVFVPWPQGSGYRYLELEANPQEANLQEDILITEHALETAMNMEKEITSAERQRVEPAQKGFLSDQELKELIAEHEAVLRQIIEELEPEHIRALNNIFDFAIYSGTSLKNLSNSYRKPKFIKTSDPEITDVYSLMENRITGLIEYRYRDLPRQQAIEKAKAELGLILEHAQALLEPIEFNAGRVCLMME